MGIAEWFTDLVAAQKRGDERGIASVCSAHPVVLEAAMAQAAEDGLPVLIESTVNQVNQFGGYTGMTPPDFRALVMSIADAVGFPEPRVILGGDHLGPYPWRAEPAAEAMAKSAELVASCVRAGYVKIHLDASMPLGGDRLDAHGGLDPGVAADREADLAAAAEAAHGEVVRAAASPDGARRTAGGTDRAAGGSVSIASAVPSAPVYVIGTEVPPPGGIRTDEAVVPVTRVDDLTRTVALCRDAFVRRGLDDAWSRTVAAVAQPGVEFGDHEVHAYDRAMAAELSAAARRLPGVVLEGHSTDYQSPANLRQLVRDGVAILKVGPALTFALRESLFALEAVERELVPAGTARGGRKRSNLGRALERAMVGNPVHWDAYYQGSDEERRIARRFSLSDRSRYYWAVPEVRDAVARLVANLRLTGIPLPLLSQYRPLEFRAVRAGRLAADPEALLRESIRIVLRDYSAAVTGRDSAVDGRDMAREV